MKSFFASLVVAASVATAAVAQQYTVNTPLSVVVCQPALLNWVGGTPPYFLSILPANQPSAPALVDLGQQSGNSVTWLANLGVGTSGFLNLRDSTGAIAQSGPFTVQSGSNTTCVGQPLSASPGAPATGAPAPGTPAGNTTPTPAASNTGASQTTKPTTSAGSAAASPTSGAMSKYAGAGAVAFVGSAILSIVL